jgi:hypothetical protein
MYAGNGYGGGLARGNITKNFLEENPAFYQMLIHPYPWSMPLQEGRVQKAMLQCHTDEPAWQAVRI